MLQNLSPIYWRKNLKHLAHVSPSNFQVKSLGKRELKRLIIESEVNASLNLEKEKFFLFFCEKYVYGVFKPVSFTTTSIKLHNLTNYERPIRVIGISNNPKRLQKELSNKTKLLNLLEQENLVPNFLLLSLVANELEISLSWSSELLENLIYHINIKADEDKSKVRQIIGEVSNILSTKDVLLEKNSFEKITKYGEILGKLFQTENIMMEKIDRFDSILLKNFPNWPLQIMNFKHVENEQHVVRYPFCSLSTHHVSRYANPSIPRTKNSIQINSFSTISYLDDVNSKRELFEIKKARKNCTRRELPTSHFAKEGGKQNPPLLESDFVHLIAHGENQNDDLVFCNEDEVLFSSKEFLTYPIMTKVLFLSMCYSNHTPLVEHFFKCGGQTIIVCDGSLSTREMANKISLFYWMLFSARSNVSEAFQAMVKKNAPSKRVECISNEIIWVGTRSDRIECIYR